MAKIEREVEIEKEESLQAVGLEWSKDCIEKFGFVYTLGLLEFLSVTVKEDMKADWAKFNFEMETKQ
jgi:hypothetical protein